MAQSSIPLTQLSEAQRAQAQKRYRDKGLAGLADAVTRSDKGKSRRLPPDAVALIEGLALQKPQRSMAALHRQVVTIAEEQGWKPPGYDRVRQIMQNIDSSLLTLAHEGEAVCCASVSRAL